MEQDLRQYVDALQNVREAEFRDWLNGLSDWAAIVNLPGLTHCFGGRVFEAIAAGRPVISWEVPGRPKTNALFQNNHEIVLFSAIHPKASRNESSMSCRTRNVPIQSERTDSVSYSPITRQNGACSRCLNG